MGKTQIVINEYFAVLTDPKGNEVEVIYSPPLLAESRNIRIELRMEKMHSRPHIHIIKKGRKKSFDVSLALDNFDILAGKMNLKHFSHSEYEAIVDFIVENQDRFRKIYKTLRSSL